MKIYIQIYLGALFFLVFVARVYSENTNEVYLPQASNPGFSDVAYLKSKNLIEEAAIKAGECRPAELDPEGHWGTVTAGFQLSLSSHTNVFVVSNAMPVTVILRNISTNTLLRLSMTDNQEMHFIVEGETGHVHEYFMDSGAGIEFTTIPPKRQVKHEYDLNYQCRLSAGSYKISVKQLVIGKKMGKDCPTNVISGNLQIKVVLR